jgi:hypothetical protein
MTQFTVNVHRLDPYKHFKFCVRWDGKYVPGVFRASGLHRTTAVVEHREGGEAELKSYRRDIVIEVLNEAGQLALAWQVFRCWPQHYDAFVEEYRKFKRPFPPPTSE